MDTTILNAPFHGSHHSGLRPPLQFVKYGLDSRTFRPRGACRHSSVSRWKACCLGIQPRKNNHRISEHSVSNVWLAETDKPGSARRVTTGEFYDRSPKPSPDGESIAFISDRGKRGKASSIHLLAPDGGPMRVLTPEESEAGISKIEFDPDGNRIAFLMVSNKSPEVKAKGEAGDDADVWDADWRFASLHTVEVKSGLVGPLFQDDVHATAFAWNEDGTEVAVVSTRNPHIESPFLFRPQH